MNEWKIAHAEDMSIVHDITAVEDVNDCMVFDSTHVSWFDDCGGFYTPSFMRLEIRLNVFVDNFSIVISKFNVNDRIGDSEDIVMHTDPSTSISYNRDVPHYDSSNPQMSMARMFRAILPTVVRTARAVRKCNDTRGCDHFYNKNDAPCCEQCICKRKVKRLRL